MADSTVITIPLCLPHAEATALARLACLIEQADCARFAAPCTVYDGKPEADVMNDAVLTLSGALAGAGFVRR